MVKVAAEKKYFALLILGAIGVFLFFAAMPLIAGISGAAIFYVLFKPLYLRTLAALGGRKGISAFLVICASIILVIVPLSYVAWVGLGEAAMLLANVEGISEAAGSVASGLGYDGVDGLIRAHATDIAGIAELLMVEAVADIAAIALNLVVMYLVLYYALTEHEKAAAGVRGLLPFSEKNSSRLMKEFTGVIRTTVIGNGASSLALGVLLAVGLWVVGMENFLFWALVGTIMAFMPIIGIQIIWVPAGIFFFLNGDYAAAAGIAAWGAFLSYAADGFVRQLVQKRVGEMHPLISLLGLIVGIMYFGVVGIIVGPLILAVFILLAKMFREEYVPAW